MGKWRGREKSKGVVTGVRDSGDPLGRLTYCYLPHLIVGGLGQVTYSITSRANFLGSVDRISSLKLVWGQGPPRSHKEAI